MTPEKIMEAAKLLYADAQTTSSISGARQAAMRAASLVFYLAKLHLPPGEQKKAMKGPPPPRKRAAKKRAAKKRATKK